MLHRKRSCFLAMALIAVCAAGSQAQTTLRFQFKDKEKLYYVVEQKTKSLLKILGQVDVNSNVNSTMAFYWEVVKLDQGNAQVRIKFTHSKMSMDSLLGNVEVDSKDKSLPNDATGKMLGQFNRVIAAMEITATMLPTGEMKDVKVAEATAKALKAIPSAELAGDLAHPDNFRDMLSSIVFSTEPVAKDKSWTYKCETYSPEGKLNTENVFTLEDTIQQDGAALEKISLKQNIKIVADPKAMIKVSSIKSSGHLLFDNKLGRFVGSTINQTKVGKIEVMGVGVDMNSDQTTVIRLAGQSADEKTELANKIESFKIDETEFVEKVVASQTLETIAGVSRSFTVMRNYEPAIVMTNKAPVPEELKGKVEGALDIVLGKKVQVKETITLDGKDVTKLKVLFVEQYRRGTAVTGAGTTISYEVRVGLNFKLEKAK